MYQIRKESTILAEGQTPEEAISKLTERHEKTELWLKGMYVAELEHTEEKVHTHWVGDYMAILHGFPPSSSISPGPRIKMASRWEEIQETLEMSEPLTMPDMMGKVLSNPTMYLAEANIFKFEDFWHGWVIARNRPDETKFMKEFYEWAMKKLKSKYPPENGWAAMFHQVAKEKQREETEARRNKPIIKSDDNLFCSKHSEELAFDYLSTYWFRFIQEAPQEIFPYDAEKAKHTKPWRTIDDL